jgi:hypothetical protein
MGTKNKLNYCRVCGFSNGPDFYPWGDDGCCPTYDFCFSCGVEFGYEDCCIKGIKSYREAWIKNGTVWDNLEVKPKDWSLEEQLKDIPEEFK